MLEAGFFDSINGDRTYNSRDFSDFFEGIIADGIYASVGKAFQVFADGSGLQVSVDTGRAKILNRYVRNTSILTKEVDAPDTTNARWDAVVLKIDLDSRGGYIDILTGTPAEDPQKPTTTDTATAKSFVLAYVKVLPQTTAITSENIENNRGAANCPWVAGILDISNIIQQHEESVIKAKSQIDELVYDTRTELNQIETDMRLQMEQDISESKQEIDRTKANFETWWNDVKQRSQRLQNYTGWKAAETDGQTDFEILDGINFNIDKHVIIVYRNGIHLIVGHEYTIDYTTTPQIIRLFSGVSVGDVISYDVIKFE